MKKQFCIVLIALSISILKAQTTFTASILKGDTIKSSVMLKATKIRATGITATDTVKAKSHLVADLDLQVKGNLSVAGRFDLSNGLAFKTFPAAANHPAVMTFGNTSRISIGPGINPGGSGQDPQDVASCAIPILGANPLFSFYGSLKASNGISGSTILGHDGANGIIDVQGTGLPNNPGSLLINYYCHRSVAICTGFSPNPSENKVFIGNFLNAAKHVEIGSLTSPNTDATNTSLDIFSNAGNGIKFITNNNNMPIISVLNSNFTTSPFTVLGDGKVFIGPQKVIGTHANARLQVDGKIASKSLFVLKPTNWADHVFTNKTKENLKEVENYIIKYNHLPGIKNEADVIENGYDVNEMDAVLLEKIENLYLYIIQQQKEIDELKSQIKNK